MTRWWQPSLVRRLVVALMAAFLLVWGVLIAIDYLEYRKLSQRSAGLELLAKNLADSLPVEDEAQVIAVVRAAEMQYNRLRQMRVPADVGQLLFVLERRDGTRLYASRDARDLNIPSTEAPPDRLVVSAREYRSVVTELDRWRLQILEPVIADTLIVWLLGSELLVPLLVAFPLVLIPLWLAVYRGLRPLHRLALEIEGRRPDDFSPLSLRVEHAELKPLLAAFNHLLAVSRRGIERERAFVQDAAHELRTPLAAVDAQAHLLARSSDDTQQAEARVALERSVQRASHLVHQLLTLATLEADPRVSEQAIDVVSLARELVIAETPRAMAKAIEVTLESPERLALRLDATAFHSVLGNLLDNALAYCPPGTRVSISLSLEANGNELRLAVLDDGPGVSQGEMPRLFERFYRGQGAVGNGSGLGLSIVQQAVRRMGGRLAVSAGNDGRGLVVTVWVPNA